MPTMFADLFVQALYVGSEWALIAIGFGLVARTCGLYHLAIGALFGVGAYVAYAAFAHGSPRSAAVVVGVAATALVSVAIDRFVYQRVTGLQGERNVGHLAPFVASLGVLTVLRSLLQLIFGASPLAIEQPALGVVTLGRVHVLGWNLAQAAVAFLAIVALDLWLRLTRAGLGVAALAESAEGASVVGVSERWVRLQIFAATGALAGVAGALSIITHPISPGDGFQVMLYGSLISLLLPSAGPLGWWAASVAAALVYGVAIVWVGGGWEDTILQAALLGAIVVTRVLWPRLRAARAQRRPASPRLQSVAEGAAR